MAMVDDRVPDTGSKEPGARRLERTRKGATMPTREQEKGDSKRPGRAGGMRLAIVGCGGYIGSHLLHALLVDDSIRIDGWDPQTDKISRHLSNPNVNIRQNQLAQEDMEEFSDAVRSEDVVINLAAICNPSEYNVNPINVIRTNFLEPVRIVDI